MGSSLRKVLPEPPPPPPTPPDKYHAKIRVGIREKPVEHYWSLQGGRKCFILNGRYNTVELMTGKCYKFENPYHDDYPLQICKMPRGGELIIWKMEGPVDYWTPDRDQTVFYTSTGQADKAFIGGMIILSSI